MLEKMIKILFLLTFFAGSLAAQDALEDLAGEWEGTITQFEGGYRSEYEITLYLDVEDDQVSGESYIAVDSIYVAMEIEGKVHNDMLIRIKDLKITDSKIHKGMEWCFKQYQLIVKREGDEVLLEGYWQGKTSFSDCIPGKVNLKRPLDRA